MTSSQPLSLEKSMNQFRRELTDEQEKEISGANRKAINHEIEKMQAQLGREKRLCRLSRIKRFLDAMEHIEKLVTIFLNVSEAVAFIWGPIKLGLMATEAWTHCIEKLLDVYEEVADTLDNLMFFQALIKSDERFSRMLEDYFSDILRFHHSILDFFSRPDWRAKFQWFWGDFRRKIKPIIESLKRKQAMLSDDKLQPHAILKAIEDCDIYARDQFKQIASGIGYIIDSEEIRNQKLQEQDISAFLQTKLSVSFPQIRDPLEVPGTVISSSGGWIFSDTLFQSWEANTSSQGSVLFLTGCPGAGKTTLARRIIQHLNEKRSKQPSPGSSVIYFFFKYKDTDRRSARSMLCHIITQVIYTDDAMMRFVYDQLSSIDYLDLPILKSLALDCLSSKRDPIIVLDGLDEGNDDEPQRAIKWCLGELLAVLSSRGCHVRLLVCGQEDGRIEPHLSSYPQIRLHRQDQHQKDIEEYCKAQASSITTRFRLPPHDQSALIRKVTKASNGMFLYTKVVLENLASMGSKKEFKAELTSNRFPRNLDEAYGRIVQRVIRSAQPPAEASAKKILGLLVCSERPLRWREIQSRFCIDANEELCDPDDLRVDTCKQLCSSLVDTTDCETFPGVQSEQTISMIHETASKYLVYTGIINILEEHIAMSIFCCRYLSSKPLIAADSGRIQNIVQTGYFSFLDYAAVYYESHFQRAESLKNTLESTTHIEIAEKAFSKLKKAYRDEDSNTTAGVSPHEGTLDAAIQSRVLVIRSIIDSQRDTISQNTGFLDLEGPKRYKCPRLQCYQFYTGCSSYAALQGHLASHDRPFRCNHEGCFAYTVGYPSQQALRDHSETFHYEDSQCTLTFPASTKTTQQDFIKACKVGNLDNVKSLHLLGADLSSRSYQKTSPLMVAVEGGHAHICKYLIDNGVSPLDTRSESKTYKKSPLHLAVRKKNIQILELFLLGYKELIPDLNMYLLSSCASDVLANFPPAVDLLLQLVSIRPSPDSEAMHRTIAGRLGFHFGTWGPQVMNFSGAHTVINHSNDTTSLHNRFRQLFPRLHDERGILSLDPNCQEYKICQQAFKLHVYLLHDAFLVKQYPLAAFLMDIDNENLLHKQDTGGNMPIHRFLIKSCKQACVGCVTMAKRLTKVGGGKFNTTPNGAGKLPIHLAIELDPSPPLLQAILDSAMDLNYKDDLGFSPLHYVQSEGSLSILLQRKDVDLFSRNWQGQTVFAAICAKPVKENRYGKILDLLLKADPRLAWTADESPERFTPLHHAMTTGCKDYAELLLQLPNVEEVLKAFLATGVRGSEDLQDFAHMRGLEWALKMMEVLGLHQYALIFSGN